MRSMLVGPTGSGKTMLLYPNYNDNVCFKLALSREQNSFRSCCTIVTVVVIAHCLAHFRYSRSRVSPTAVIQGNKPTSKFNKQL